MNSNALSELVRWADFFKWLGIKIGVVEAPQWATWCQVLRHLRAPYPASGDGDGEAITQLGAWYLEFLDSETAR